MFKYIKDRLQGKAPGGKRRSSKWSKVRKDYLKEHVVCAVCGGKKKLEVHHLIPFHIKPELELAPTNFIVLCECKKHGINCHLLVGHLGNYKRQNAECLSIASFWKEKLDLHYLEGDINAAK